MALRAIKHKFTGATTPISSYDPNKTNLGSLMIQNTGPTYLDKYAGPLPVGITCPMQEIVDNIGTVSVSSTAVTGVGTNFQASMIGMAIGFGSNNPAKITTWYTISARASTLGITLGSSAGTIVAGTPYVLVLNLPMMYPHAITYDSTTDWIFLIENSAAASASRRIFLYEFNKTNSVYTWKGFINTTLVTATAHTIRGFRALRYLHTTGTISVSTTTVTGIGTKFQDEGIAVGARIGFGSTDPTAISTWYVISAIGSDTSITLSGSAGTIGAGSLYVIEELRFVITTTNATPLNGGLFLVKGINYSDFLNTGTIIPVATTVDNIKAVYWLSDSGTTGNIVTNISACGCTIQQEVNKGLHYAYVVNGTGSTYVNVFRYNLRATGALASGKMTLSINSYTTGSVGVSNGVVTGSGTVFTSSMVGMRIGLGSLSPALITTWYTIGTFTSTTSIALTDLTLNMGSGASYIIDSADVLCTAPQLVTGTISAINNGRVGTLRHGPSKDEESLYFVTTTRIYRAALSKIYQGNLDWVSGNAQEIPPGGVGSFAATNLLSSIEIADSMDRLIILTTGGTSVRHYVTKYTAEAGEPFDHIFGINDRQQDQILARGDAYITSGTVAVSGTTVTGTRTFFTAAMVGFRIGFGTTDPTAVSTWYTILSYASITSITLSASAGTIGAGSAYVIDWNSGTIPHFTTSLQATSVWSENGIAHIVKHGTTPALCQMYALPLSAHWTNAGVTKERIITPALYTPACVRFMEVVVSDQNRIGSGEFSITPEPWRIYFRTKGIDLNVGEWTLVGEDGDLSGLSGSRFIQFMFEFVTIGLTSIPARIMSLTVIYDDELSVTDSHFEPSMSKSSGADKQFAWRFAAAFASTVPTLRIRLYNAVTGDLLMDDYTTGNGGTWEKTTDGISWGAYNTTNKTNETTYIRYTPLSLYDNIKIRAVLTE
jgi:hypothetical protein